MLPLYEFVKQEWKTQYSKVLILRKQTDDVQHNYSTASVLNYQFSCSNKKTCIIKERCIFIKLFPKKTAFEEKKGNKINKMNFSFL